jgi:hypothetical protein
MKTKSILTVASAAVLAMAVALPAYAGTQAIGDEDLDAIAGKANTATFTGADVLTITTGNSANGNVQVGYYQWDDTHATDGSLNKGANDQSGATSNVQANVVSVLNIIGWGAAAQVSTVNSADIGADQATESWATLYVGGF